MDALWVVPCRFDESQPVIFECIQAIKEHHEKPNILVIDSNSPDKSYLTWCIEQGCRVGPTNNALYALGAHAWAFRHYPDCEFFYFIFDSLVVTANCDEYRNQPVTVMRHWTNRDHDWGWDHDGTHLSVWGRQQLERMGVTWPNDYCGILGPMYFMDRPTGEKLDAMGYWFTQTTSGYLQCAMERVAGICLEALDVDIPSVSIQGLHTSHQAHYDESIISKRDLARA